MATHAKLPTGWYKDATEYNAETTPGAQIRIWGLYGNHRSGPQTFDRTFKVGDVVEYDSYNLSYTGPITAIGPKTVTIKAIGDRSRRLDLTDFITRNWDLDLAKIAKTNSEWMD